MAHLRFGNESVIRIISVPTWAEDGTLVSEEKKIERYPGRAVTTYGPPDHWGLDDILITFIAQDGMWASHSDMPPTWVECDDDPILAHLFARHYHVPVGRPEDWQATIMGAINDEG